MLEVSEDVQFVFYRGLGSEFVASLEYARHDDDILNFDVYGAKFSKNHDVLLVSKMDEFGEFRKIIPEKLSHPITIRKRVYCENGFWYTFDFPLSPFDFLDNEKEDL